MLKKITFPPLAPEIDPNDRAAVCERISRLKSPFVVMSELPPGWTANLTRAADRTWSAVINPPGETFPACTGHKDDRAAMAAAFQTVLNTIVKQPSLEAA